MVKCMLEQLRNELIGLRDTENKVKLALDEAGPHVTPMLVDKLKDIVTQIEVKEKTLGIIVDKMLEAEREINK